MTAPTKLDAYSALVFVGAGFVAYVLMLVALWMTASLLGIDASTLVDQALGAVVALGAGGGAAVQYRRKQKGAES